MAGLVFAVGVPGLAQDLTAANERFLLVENAGVPEGRAMRMEFGLIEGQAPLSLCKDYCELVRTLVDLRQAEAREEAEAIRKLEAARLEAAQQAQQEQAAIFAAQAQAQAKEERRARRRRFLSGIFSALIIGASAYYGAQVSAQPTYVYQPQQSAPPVQPNQFRYVPPAQLPTSHSSVISETSNCFSNYSCPAGQECFRVPALGGHASEGRCFGKVNEFGTPQRQDVTRQGLTQGVTCQFNTDCPLNFRCIKSPAELYGLCGK